MIKKIMLTEANDLKDFMVLACKSPCDVGVHTPAGQIADGKSILGLMALDYKEPIKVVCEDLEFMRKIARWSYNE